ncbi:ZYRO0C04290p [Zygosaccharomyces rouxii]|uniref:ZYRO0C04290p n=1 Tax=Zygosaccharomyces rouxii (strain ATCC 2623 / CBS 732 / NBRC 1130 / NCYC 568 / NRRL Y-229) TaxID=559307 RepID=C5DT00_ZYGRC|nr:uncharacterized protein ZYRO0C04290g [Zygosaccharomyces rouxii]KAH9201900.1 hypothetical protein LQ764DRAFT_89613 [Zygosaccharomyces rouxii]CAR26911.1 ZYRO0C04290p [Zygosaccharomyces rouxii]
MSGFNTGRTPCRYFQQGRCNKGNSCKFAHVYSNGSGASGQGTGQSMSEAELLKSFINPSSLPKIARTINNDMKDAETFQLKPMASAYSYGSPCAVNLISGRDYSPEESRLDYYNAQRQGIMPQYMTQVSARESDMQECMNFTKAHTDWAARYLQVNTKQLTETGRRSIENEFINFPLDLTGTRSKSGSFGANPFTSPPSLNGGDSGAFGQPSFGGNTGNSSNSAFGTPSFGSSAFGGANTTTANNNTNAGSGGVFGQPAFGNTSNLGSSFGTSSVGSNPFTSNSGGSAFGKPAFGSAPGSSESAFGKPAFGSTTTPPASGGSAFGKPSFGSSAFGQSAFGANAQQQQQQQQPQQQPPSTAGSVFGQPPFGSNAAGAAPATGSSVFGQPSAGSQANATSAFGKPMFGSTPGQSNSTGASAFGQPNFKPSPFGASNNATQNASPFGTSAFTQNQSPFSNNTNTTNTTSTTSTAPFGSAPTSSSSPFSSLQQNQNQAKPEPISQTTFGSQTQPSSSPFGNAQQPSVAPFGSSTGPKSSPFSNVANPSISQPTAPKFTQGLPTEEDNVPANELDQKTLQQFQMDHFNLGEVPDIPPPLELIA